MVYTKLLKSVDKGTESLSFLRPKIWKVIPEGIKLMKSLQVFKIAVKNGNLIILLRLCWAYIP